MEPTTITENEEGKPVVNPEGEKVGMVVEVREGIAYVDPDPGMFESIKAKLNWGDVDEDAYPLSSDDVEEVTDDELRLRRF